MGDVGEISVISSQVLCFFFFYYCNSSCAVRYCVREIDAWARMYVCVWCDRDTDPAESFVNTF